MGWMGHDPGMNSRVHPKYKRRKRSFRVYRVGNWAEYDRALVQRGDVTLWISTDAIETALILRLVFKLPLRQAEGFLRSLLSLMDVDLEAPDHTTVSRRSQHLNVGLHFVPIEDPIHLIVDSTGLSIVGEGEWAAAKHGGHGKRGWKKLHLGVDRSGVIVVGALTDGNADDAKTAQRLIDQVHGDIASFTADAAHDTNAIYDTAAVRGAEVVIPPAKSSTRSRRRRSRSSARDRTIMSVKEVGRRRWKKESGYHRQARVENTFFRCKAIIGDRLAARHPKSQGSCG